MCLRSLLRSELVLGGENQEAQPINASTSTQESTQSMEADIHIDEDQDEVIAEYMNS